MTDFRKLCDELLDELQFQTDWSVAEELKERARAALAEPEPEEPTETEIASILLAYAVVEPQAGLSRILHEKHFGNAARRPKPPSLKEQALAKLPEQPENMASHLKLTPGDVATIRRALESLPD